MKLLNLDHVPCIIGADRFRLTLNSATCICYMSSCDWLEVLIHDVEIELIQADTGRHVKLKTFDGTQRHGNMT